MFEESALHGAGMVNLIHDTHIDLFPEAGDGRHTGGMCLAHRLLDILWMGVDNHGGSLRHSQDGPATFEDVRVGQEVHDAVVLVDRHTLAVGFEGSMELSVCQDDSL